jgi:hypothetical protein
MLCLQVRLLHELKADEEFLSSRSNLIEALAALKVC